jgi:iron(III) transport system permease protein
MVWAYLVRFCAVALQSVQSGYARIPASLDDSARMLGTAGFGLMARVHWPLLRRSTAAAALLVFVDVMKELPATMVLRPFNSDTLAVVAYQLARDERLGEAALPSLALVLVGLMPVILLSRTLRGAKACRFSIASSTTTSSPCAGPFAPRSPSRAILAASAPA